MFKFLRESDDDRRKDAAIKYKKRYEEDRKPRIFNARTRILGNDIHTLDDQINDKKRRAVEEKERERKFISEALHRDVILIEKAKQEEDARRQKQRDVHEYNINCMKKEFSREFDMNDPKYLKHSQPPRMTDNDMRLSVSGAQLFLGEDLRDAERKKAQIEQMKSWLDQQIFDKKRNEKESKKADDVLNEALKAHDLRQVELEQERLNVRRKRDEAIARFNSKLSIEHEINKLQHEKEQEEDDLAEMYNVLTSEMMTESKDCSSVLGPNRKQTTKYRGMNDDEIRDLREEQVRQKSNLEEIHNQKKHENERWNNITMNMDKMTLAELQKEQKNDLQMRIDVRDYNKTLAAEQKSRNKYMDQVVYKNDIKPYFFTNFNTTTR